MYGSGNIYVRPQNARLFRETEIMGVMEPYIRVTVGYQSQYTRRGVGKTPVWSYENLPFQYNSADRWIVVEVFDHDAVGKDELVGGGCFSLASLVELGRVVQPIPIYYRDKPVGDVMVDLEFIPTGMSQHQSPPGYSTPYSHMTPGMSTVAGSPSYMPQTPQSPYKY